MPQVQYSGGDRLDTQFVCECECVCVNMSVSFHSRAPPAAQPRKSPLCTWHSSALVDWQQCGVALVNHDAFSFPNLESDGK